MSDENRDMESGEAGFAALPSVGSQLRAAREKKEMSVGDIAMALKLGPRQVEALESGEWDRLPGNTFIRGFVRNYARLLQLDAAPFMAQLDSVLEAPQQRLSTVPSMPRATMPQAGRGRRRDYAIAAFGLALVAIAAAIYFLLPADLSSLRSDLDSVLSIFSSQEKAAAPAGMPAAAPAEPAAPEPVFPPGSTPQQVMNPQAVTPAEAPPAAAPASPALVPPPVLPTPAAPAAVPVPSAPAGPASAAPAPAVAGAALRFTFEQDSWVEVRDHNGKIVFSQLGTAGTERDVGGQGPFSLVIGNAPGVRLSLRGQPVDLASHTQGNVARLTVE